MFLKHFNFSSSQSLYFNPLQHLKPFNFMKLISLHANPTHWNTPIHFNLVDHPFASVLILWTKKKVQHIVQLVPLSGAATPRGQEATREHINCVQSHYLYRTTFATTTTAVDGEGSFAVLLLGPSLHRAAAAPHILLRSLYRSNSCNP